VTQLRLQVTIECVTFFAGMLDLMHLRKTAARDAERALFACSKRSHNDRYLRSDAFYQIAKSCERDDVPIVLHCTLDDRIPSHMNCLPSSAI
jgi:hypothetical protein